MTAELFVLRTVPHVTAWGGHDTYDFIGYTRTAEDHLTL